jgi:transcriptional regulator with XRE-family HTH domain
MPKTDLQKQIDRLAKAHGGLRAAARAVGMDPAYLWRLRQGKKKNPTPKTLEKLGLRRTERLVLL